MTRVRLPLRLARREVWCRPGRTALVALLVAIPVAGMAVAVTLIRSEAETPVEDWQQEFGGAEAAASGDAAALLPEGSRTVTYQEAFLRLRTPDRRRADAVVTTLPLDDPMVDGIYQVVEGRAATSPDEAVLTPRLAEDLGVTVGDTLRLDRPPLEVSVVGEAERLVCLSCRTLLLRTDLDALGVADGPSSGPAEVTVLADLPGTTTDDELVELQRAGGGRLTIRSLRILDPYVEVDGGRAVTWSLVLGAVVLTVVGVVIAAAFAVGARRQLVTLGQLSASGTPPSVLRSALALQGTVVGCVGAVTGLALAAVVLLVMRERIEQLIDQRLRSYDVPVGDLALVVAFGVVAATVAALIPARTAARIPTLAALAGRRPLRPVSRRLVAWGFGWVAIGLALLFIAALGIAGNSGGEDTWAYVAIAGGVLELLGACAIAPAIVARLEPLSRRLRGSLRLGARTLARHRARTGAVVSAVAAAGALAVVGGAVALGMEQQEDPEMSLPEDVVVALTASYDEQGLPTTFDLSERSRQALADAVPEARATDLRAVAAPNTPGSSTEWEFFGGGAGADFYAGAPVALVADDPVLDAIGADAELRSGLAEHGLVALTARDEVGDGEVHVPDGRRLPAALVHSSHHLGYAADILITEQQAGELGLTIRPAGALLRLEQPITEAQRHVLEELSYEFTSEASGLDLGVMLDWHEGSARPSPFLMEVLLAGIALVLCLFVVGVSLALAAAEGKDERDILTIAGAPPAAIARSAGARAWLMAFVGAAIAVPIGFLPVVVVSWASHRDPHASQPFPIVFPTRTVTLLLVVLPLVVCAVAWIASATAQRLRPVRVSTAAFE